MTRPEIAGISPFFIVQDAAAALSFYSDRLGFEITFQEPAYDPFFGIVCRGGGMMLLKRVGVVTLPNYKRGPGARWDGYHFFPHYSALGADVSWLHGGFSQPRKMN